MMDFSATAAEAAFRPMAASVTGNALCGKDLPSAPKIATEDQSRANSLRCQRGNRNLGSTAKDLHGEKKTMTMEDPEAAGCQR